MNKKSLFIFILIGMIIGGLIGRFVLSAFGFEQHDAMTIYTMTTDEPITIAWDDSDPQYFNFYVWNFGEERIYLNGETQQTQVTIYLPRTGLWIFYCAECDSPASNANRQCSGYAQSNLIEFSQVRDPVSGNYIAGRWMIYSHVSPPSEGGVIINP